MALHIARRRSVASSAGSPTPANPAMPHMSARPQHSSYRRRAGLFRVTARHVGGRPEDRKEEIKHRDPGVAGEDSGDEESYHRPVNPPGLDRAVIRLQLRALTSHLSEYRSHQTNPEQQAGESHLRSQTDIRVVRIMLPQLWRIARVGFLVPSDADPQYGVTRGDMQAGLEDCEALAGGVPCEQYEFLFLAE